MPEPPALPGWLTEADIQAYAEDFARHGASAFTGPLNWYRNIDRNAELLAAFKGRGIDVPALYVVGDLDMVTSLRGPKPRTDIREVAPHLHTPVILPGCGHWTQQERSTEVNTALLDFLARLDGSTSA